MCCSVLSPVCETDVSWKKCRSKNSSTAVYRDGKDLPSSMLFAPMEVEITDGSSLYQKNL